MSTAYHFHLDSMTLSMAGEKMRCSGLTDFLPCTQLRRFRCRYLASFSFPWQHDIIHSSENQIFQPRRRLIISTTSTAWPRRGGKNNHLAYQRHTLLFNGFDVFLEDQHKLLITQTSLSEIKCSFPNIAYYATPSPLLPLRASSSTLSRRMVSGQISIVTTLPLMKPFLWSWRKCLWKRLVCNKYVDFLHDLSSNMFILFLVTLL